MNFIFKTWISGGWTMIPLVFVCIFMSYFGITLLINSKRFKNIILDDYNILHLNKEITKSKLLKDFEEKFNTRFNLLNQTFSILKTLVAMAPLVGLLGTVHGMLTTFKVLAVEGGGKLSESLSAGISLALYPPEIGLCIALVGLILIYFIQKNFNECYANYVKLESQHIQKYLMSNIYENSK
jgi:biopolymer transport protein ExbB/TolQ